MDLSSDQFPEATRLHKAGRLCFEQGNFAQGIEYMGEAIALKPDFANAHYDRALAFMMLGIFPEAAMGYRDAITHNPDFAEAYNNLGNALQELNDYVNAVANYDRAIALKPAFAQAYTGKGKALHEMKRYDEALACYDKAIALNPDEPRSYLNKGFLKLLHGNFEEGWKLYDWRWKKNQQDNYILSQKPLWRGEPLAGKTILLHAEQGLGDTIQCCRYIPMVEALGAMIILKVPLSLKSLIKTLRVSFRLIADGEDAGEFDMHCPLFNLPLAFATRANNIPAPIPYLFADAEKQNSWQSILGLKTKPRIGLVWSGSATNTKDRNRNIPLPLLLSALGDTYELHALQKDIKAEDEVALKQGRVISHAGKLHDVSDTAALVADIDLVVSVDTSVAHLAGVMGKKLWLLLPFMPDYRWMIDRNDSPWYPNARLFRQTEIGDWESVIEEIKKALVLSSRDLIAGSYDVA